VVVGTCSGVNVVTSDQYIAIVLPGRMFRAEFERRGLAPVVFSRTVGDSVTVTSPLILWNSCGSLHLSIPAPLNPARKPLSWLARDLEAEARKGAKESRSICRKARPCSSLALLLVIILVLTQ
jgi:hypothetical protein